MNDILLPRNDINFPLVKVIVSKIAYKIIQNTKNEHFLIGQKLVQTDQGYQSHQLPTNLDT